MSEIFFGGGGELPQILVVVINYNSATTRASEIKREILSMS